MKLLAVRPAKPKFCTVAVPNKRPSQFIEYWKANISVKPLAITSTHVCSPQLTVVVVTLKFNGVAGTLVSVVSVLVSALVQEMLTDPFCKLGVKPFPSKSVTSILNGTSLIVTGLRPLALAGISKQT